VSSETERKLSFIETKNIFDLNNYAKISNLSNTAIMKVRHDTVLYMEARKVGEVYFKLAKYKLRDKVILQYF
jgi:hypothetical protein